MCFREISSSYPHSPVGCLKICSKKNIRRVKLHDFDMVESYNWRIHVKNAHGE